MIANRVIGGNGGETASIFITGLSETDTVTATKDGKTYNGKYAQTIIENPEYHNLPDGYEELEYIQSTGAQYLKTGIYHKSTTTVEIDFMYTAASGCILGCDYQRGEGDIRPDTLTWGDVHRSYTISANSRYNVKMSSGGIYVDGSKIGDSGSLYNGARELYLFCRNSYSSLGNPELYSSAKIYILKAWTDGILTHNYIPCIRKSDNVAGLYNTVTGDFIVNVGSGTLMTGDYVHSTITVSGHLIDNLKEYGTYTVAATDGTNTTTQDVLVDMATQYDIQMSYQTDWLLTSDDFQNGTFKNGTHSILTNQVNGTDGLRFVGAASNSNNSTYGGYYQLSGYIRLDLTIDFTNFSKLKFKGKKVTNHGIIRAVISDGLNNLSKSYIDADPQSNKTYPSNYCAPTTVVYGKSVYMPYSDTTAGTWYDCEIDLSEITGEHILSFVGGYTDPSGYPSSETHYCDIWLMK